MQPQPYDGDLEEYVALALKLCRATDAEALLVMRIRQLSHVVQGRPSGPGL